MNEFAPLKHRDVEHGDRYLAATGMRPDTIGNKCTTFSRIELFCRGIKAALDDIRKSDKVAMICTYLFVEICTYFEYDAINTYIVFTITIYSY